MSLTEALCYYFLGVIVGIVVGLVIKKETT